MFLYITKNKKNGLIKVSLKIKQKKGKNIYSKNNIKTDCAALKLNDRHKKSLLRKNFCFGSITNTLKNHRLDLPPKNGQWLIGIEHNYFVN